MERESALLAMLVAMDGIHGNLEQVGWLGCGLGGGTGFDIGV